MAHKKLPWWAELAIQVVMIGASVGGMLLAVRIMDPNREQKEVSKKKATELMKRIGKNVDLNEYEMLLAACVMNPTDIQIDSVDLCGMESLKKDLKENVTDLMTQSRDDMTLLQPAKGVLFHGPPGTGKTMMAKLVAKESNCFFLNITISSILSKYLGDANCMVRAIFTLANKLDPCIIFIDEVDALLGKRGQGGEHEATLQVKTEFMQLWEGLESGAGRVLVMGATNRLNMIDEAFLRRFSLKCEIPLPSLDQREAIITSYVKKHEKDIDVKKAKQAELQVARQAEMAMKAEPADQAELQLAKQAMRAKCHPIAGGVSLTLLRNQEVTLSDKTVCRSISWLANNTDGYSGSDLYDLSCRAAQNAQPRPGHNSIKDYGMLDISHFEKALRSFKPASLTIDPPSGQDPQAADLSSHLNRHLMESLIELLIQKNSPRPASRSI